MTREEAKSCISTIEMLQRLAYNIHGVMDVIDADNCKKIIKALEQESSEDLISRQAVQDYIAKYLSQYLYNDVREAVEVIDEYIGELPPVKQEPKTGHWIDRHIISNRTFDMIVCSECGEEFSYDAETGISEYNYCPNCGCRMVEPQESEE